jgi:ABC-type proline/glycine betaine transport system permease subunit
MVPLIALLVHASGIGLGGAIVVCILYALFKKK